jgi:hypothetical protein
MSKDWRTLKIVEEFIDHIVISPVEAFYPTSLLKYNSTLDMKDVWDALLEQCRTEKILLKWEIICPSNIDPSCFRSAGINEDDGRLDQEVQCDLCGEAYEVKHDNIFPIFTVNEDYQAYMREGFEKKKPHIEDTISPSLINKATTATVNSKIFSMDELPPEILQSINVFIGEMNKSSHVNIIKENTFGHNTNIQSDHNTQSVEWLDDVYQPLIDNLLDEINKLEDEVDKNNAIKDIQTGKHAISQNNKERARKIFSLLPDAIKVSAAFISLYNNLT